MNLITKPVEITIKPQPQIDYVSLLGLKKEVPQSTYGITISDDVDKLRTELSLLCREKFETTNVDSPLTDCNMDELSSRGFTFFGSDITNVLILDTTNSKGCQSIIRDELLDLNDRDLGYIARYIINYPNSSLDLDNLGKLIRETNIYHDFIEKIAKSAEYIRCIIRNENLFMCDKYLCILRWE